MAEKHILTDGNKHRLREKIIQGAINFEKYLTGKSFKIICEDKSETIVRFFKRDFKHLTGIDSDLNENEFYEKCLQSHIETGNIFNEQKYDWSTLKGKSNRIENIHKLLYEDAEKTLLLNQLKVNTTVFPVAIRNDNMKTCVGFAGSVHKARSLRKSNSSKNAKQEKVIVAIYGRTNEETDFSEIVYEKLKEVDNS